MFLSQMLTTTDDRCTDCDSIVQPPIPALVVQSHVQGTAGNTSHVRGTSSGANHVPSTTASMVHRWK